MSGNSSDSPANDQALAAEFEIFAKRAGLDIPENRKPAMLKGFKDLKRMTALMRQPRSAADAGLSLGEQLIVDLQSTKKGIDSGLEGAQLKLFASSAQVSFVRFPSVEIL